MRVVPARRRTTSRTFLPVGLPRSRSRVAYLLCSVAVLLGSTARAESRSPLAAAPLPPQASDTAAAASTSVSQEPQSGTADAKQKAKERFSTGLKFYEDGDYALALIEFERAYSYVPDFRVLYNIGQVSIQLSKYAKAALALRQYLSEGGEKVPAARIAAVQSDLAMLEGRIAHLTVKSNVDGADVLLDDVLLGKTPMGSPALIDAGEHRVAVQKSGYQSRTEPLVLAGRDQFTLEVDLDEERPAAPAIRMPVSVAQQLPPVHPSPPRPRNPMLVAGWGATGVLALSWAITGYVGIKAAGDLHNAMQHTSTESELTTLRSKAKGWLLAADIVGTATVLTGGLTLYFTLKQPVHERPPPSKGPNVGIRLNTNGAQLVGTF